MNTWMQKLRPTDVFDGIVIMERRGELAALDLPHMSMREADHHITQARNAGWGFVRFIKRPRAEYTPGLARPALA